MRTFGLDETGQLVNPVRCLKETGDFVSENFETDIHEYRLAILGDMESEESIESILSAAGISVNMMQRPAFSLYTGDLNTGYDYIIGINKAEYFYPLILSEEMLHGEHMVLHAPDKTGHESYGDKFSGIARELIGSLAFYGILKEMRDSGINPEIRTGYDIGDMEDHTLLEDFMAHEIGRWLVDNNISRFYSEMFRAGDEKSLWDVVSRHLDDMELELFINVNPYRRAVHENAADITGRLQGVPLKVYISGPDGYMNAV
ncbi:MAG: hypothetical protein J7K54_03975 [Candidatus Aenigmarchaeota archaeon]|nr:hypothetical protein [Candidatus Aenigmarchaeota archaeon]